MTSARGVRRLFSVVVALIVVALGAFLFPTYAVARTGYAQSPGSPSRDDIFHAIGADNVRADYVVLIDTSGSMAAAGRYDSVRGAMSTFLQGLTAADHVALYTFDTTVSPIYSGPGSKPAGILAKLPAGPHPKGMTDIGQAISAAVDELSRPNAASVATVVLLTDGEHDPGQGSPYPHPTGDGWTLLAKRAQALQGKNVSAYAIPLAQGASGAPLLQSVFPQATVLNPASIDDLREFFNRTKKDVLVQRARSILEPDAAKRAGVVADCKPSAADSATCRVTVTNTKKFVPLSLARPVFAAVDERTTVMLEDGQESVPPTIELLPGATFVRDFRVHMSADPSWTNPFESSRLDTPVVQFTADSSSPWQESLGSDIDLHASGPVESETPTMQLSTAVHNVKVLLLYAVILIGLVVGSVMTWALLRLRMFGWITVKEVFPTEKVLAEFPLHGRTVELPSRKVPGTGTVTMNTANSGFFQKWLGAQTKELRIEYSPRAVGGRRLSSTCPTEQSVIVGGLSFEHSRKRQYRNSSKKTSEVAR